MLGSSIFETGIIQLEPGYGLLECILGCLVYEKSVSIPFSDEWSSVINHHPEPFIIHSPRFIYAPSNCLYINRRK